MPGSLKQYVLVQDTQENTFVVPVPGGRELGDFRDMVEDEIGVMTRGVVYHMSLLQLRKRAKAGEMD